MAQPLRKPSPNQPPPKEERIVLTGVVSIKPNRQKNRAPSKTPITPRDETKESPFTEGTDNSAPQSADQSPEENVPTQTGSDAETEEAKDDEEDAQEEVATEEEENTEEENAEEEDENEEDEENTDETEEEEEEAQEEEGEPEENGDDAPQEDEDTSEEDNEGEEDDDNEDEDGEEGEGGQDGEERQNKTHEQSKLAAEKESEDEGAEQNPAEDAVEKTVDSLGDKVLVWLWGATPFFGLSLIPIGIYYLLIYPYKPEVPGRELTGGDLVKIFKWFPGYGIFLTAAIEKAEIERGTILTLSIGSVAVLYSGAILGLLVVIIVIISQMIDAFCAFPVVGFLAKLLGFCPAL